MINKYIKIFIKRNCLSSLLYGAIVFLPLFAEALDGKSTLRDTAFAFLIAFAICIIYVAIASLPAIRFKRMIRRQERLYKIQFNDYYGAVNLEKTVYLSHSWIIYAGKIAVYKKHIQAISSKFINARGPSFYKVIIKTVDNKKYTLKCYEQSNLIKIHKWNKKR